VSGELQSTLGERVPDLQRFTGWTVCGLSWMLWRRKELLPLSVIESHFPIRQARVLVVVLHLAYSAYDPLVADSTSVTRASSQFSLPHQSVNVFTAASILKLIAVGFVTFCYEGVWANAHSEIPPLCSVNYSSTGGFLRWKGNSKALATSETRHVLISIYHLYLSVNILMHNPASEWDVTRSTIQ
jgi:hypothetical protein